MLHQSGALVVVVLQVVDHDIDLQVVILLVVLHLSGAPVVVVPQVVDQDVDLQVVVPLVVERSIDAKAVSAVGEYKAKVGSLPPLSHLDHKVSA